MTATNQTKFKHNLEPSPSSPNWPGYCHPSQLPAKDSWSFYLYKHGPWSWAFNFWQCQLFDEGLLNGSNECLDWHYQKLSGQYASHDAGLYATFTLQPFEGFTPTTELHYLGPDHELTGNPKCSWYLDTEAGLKWWLCPLWLDMWQGKPPAKGYLYLTLENDK